MNFICHFKNHATDHDYSLFYRDADHNIPDTIRVCFSCLLKHLRKHYPGCAIERYILDQCPELEQG